MPQRAHFPDLICTEMYAAREIHYINGLSAMANEVNLSLEHPAHVRESKPTTIEIFPFVFYKYGFNLVGFTWR